MSKTISMAQVLPGELVALKTNGMVAFNTLMRWFDRDFPGHYLRLIKSVRISMLALTPPIDGIHATLSNSGESTVVVKEGLNFKPIRSFRDFGETIALDSPFNETGLFVFNYDDPMLLPFEGLGVETQWVLELPKASNRFNPDTLVDVMLTIEYTAFQSDLYKGMIKTQLGTMEVNDIPLNIRLQYPDQWYHFKNDGVAADNTRKFEVHFPKQFLPPHYTQGKPVSSIHLTVMLIGDFEGAIQESDIYESVRIEHFQDKDDASTKTLDLDSQSSTPFKTKVFDSGKSQYALISTRDNNNQSHQLPAGTEIVGDWKVTIKEVSLPNNKTLEGQLRDVLLIFSVEGDIS